MKDSINKEFELIQAMMKDGQYEEARPKIKDYLKTHHDDPLAIRFLGNTYAYTGFLGKAKKVWRQGLKKHPKNIDLLYNLGLACYLQSKLVGARKYWKRAHKIAPKDGEILFNLGQVARDEGRLRKAIKLWKEALEVAPENVETMNNIGVAFATLGMFGKASVWYKKALAKDANYALAHFNLATAAFELGHLENSAEHAEKAADLDPATHMEPADLLLKKIKAADSTDCNSVEEANKEP